MSNETAQYEAALRLIKELVCGDKIPHWIDDFQTTLTRGRIADICDSATAVASNEPNGWRPIETSPKDGTPFLVTLRVFNAQTKEFMHHDTQVVFVDEDTGEVHADCYYGWDLADCEFWMPLPPPPLPTREPEGR